MVLRIKEIAKSKNLTLDQMASTMGITAATLSRNISGNPTVETLEKIATALDVEVYDLFEKKDQSLQPIYKEENGEFVEIGHLTKKT